MLDLQQIVSHAKEYGFVFPSSEIYGSLAATYDYGPYGAQLRNNLKEYWWRAMVQLNDNIMGIDAAIFMHPTTWKASGHVDAFNDPLIDNKDSNKRYRADVLVEDYIAKIQDKIDKDVAKARKRFGDDFDEEQFVTTNDRIIRRNEEIAEVEERLKKVQEDNDLEAFRQLIIDLDIADPVSGSRNWTDVRQFNLMFSTQLGNISGSEGLLYLRPETAQGIFVNFLSVQNTGRQKVPFGIAQIGKAFRNEIIARQFIFRMREFEQMEMQFFVRPGEEMKWYEHWKEKRLQWHHSLGLGEENYRFHDHLKLAHYANAAADIEFQFPFGFKELEGIHSRTDFDLSNHEELSGKNLKYYDPEIQESYVPYVVETSIGLDRLFLAVLSASLKEEELENGSRVVLSLPPEIAPVKVGILPLLNRDGLPEKALEIYNRLKLDYNCHYEEKDSIGKRYRRMDAIGTPYCITIDHDTLEDNTVTIRERDSMEQERVSIERLEEIVAQRVDIRQLLKRLA